MFSTRSRFNLYARTDSRRVRSQTASNYILYEAPGVPSMAAPTTSPVATEQVSYGRFFFFIYLFSATTTSFSSERLGAEPERPRGRLI